MAEPATIITWNTDGTNRTTPDAGQQAEGYAVDEIPTSGNFNFFLFWIWTWIAFFKAKVSGARTYSFGVADIFIGDVAADYILDTDYAGGPFTPLTERSLISQAGSVGAFVTIPAPVGSKLNQITLTYDRNATSMACPTILRTNLLTGAADQIVAPGANDTTSSGVTKRTVACGDIAIEADYVYEIVIDQLALVANYYGGTYTLKDNG